MKKISTHIALPLLVLGFVAAGCSASTIDGDELAEKAEEALQQQNEGLGEGTFDCPEIDREEGEKVTCTRFAQVNEYYVYVDGTVELGEIDGDTVEFKVQMEDRAKEFGTTGESIEQNLSSQAQQRFGTEPTAIECPDLPGEDGATIICSMTVDGADLELEVTATEVDLDALSMSWTFEQV